MSTVTSAITSSASAASTLWGLPSDHVPPGFVKYQAEVRDSIIALLTPLNFTLVLLLLTLLYIRLRPTPQLTLDPQKPLTFRTFTPRTLIPYNGTAEHAHNPTSAVYLAVKGKVYDVTSGRNFYGPGGPYENFAGRDATRGLACQSFDEDMLTKDLDGPLDDISDLGEDELANLQGWVERFDEKYLVVGKLIAFNNASNAYR